MNTINIRLLGVAAASAFALAGCATSAYDSGSGYRNTSPSYGSSTANCYDCGVITSIQPIDTQSR